MVRQQLYRWSVPVFLFCECALYLSFLCLDLFHRGAGTTAPKYAAILLCAAMALAGALRGGDRLVAAALVLTVCADLFLLVLNRWYLVGILFFYGVQVLYLVRICIANGGQALLLPRMVLFVLLLLILLRTGFFTPESAAGALYVTHFLFNTAQALELKGAWSRLFAWGLLLYLCCDLCVAVFNAPQLFPGFLREPARVGMWLFYLPGQVLIVLSGLILPERGVSYEAK